MIGREVFKVLLGLAISIGLIFLVKSTLDYLIPIIFILAFFGVAFLLIKPSKK